jgi:hypothetical protein
MKNILTLTLISLALIACSSLAQNGYKSAVLIEITPEIKLEIEQIITAASNGSKARLADNVFTNQSILLIEKNRPHNSNINIKRIYNEPDMYELIISDNGQCFISHTETKLQWFLFKAKCQPINLQ